MADDPALHIFPDEFVPNIQGAPYHSKWVAANKTEAAKWTTFRDDVIARKQVVPPSMATKYGKALVAAGKEHMSISHFVGTVTNPYPPAPPAAVADIFVSPSGNDSSGNGSAASPYRTLFKACSVAVAGNVIGMAPGSYTENGTCVVGNGVSVIGAGGRSSTTVISGAADPLIRYQNATQTATLKGFKLDGQNRTAGTTGMIVSNVSNLTIEDVFATKFVGHGNGGGGAINMQFATNCAVRFCDIRDSGFIIPAIATAYGSFIVGNCANCVFHDIVTHDYDAVGFKGAPGYMTDCEMYNLDCRSTWTGVFPDWDICFEFYMCSATNVKIHHSYFNSTMSLTRNNEGSLPAGQYRYEVYNNFFEMAGPSNLAAATAIEPAVYNCHIHHNYFKGGAQALSVIGHISFNPSGHRVHHNVFDNQSADYSGQIAYIQLGFFDYEVYKNTWVGRNGSLGGYIINAQTASSPSMYANLFTATSAITDKFAPASVGVSLVDNNAFYNVPVKGTNPLTLGAQPIPLSGGFPSAYIATGAGAGYGALADGSFSVGIQ